MDVLKVGHRALFAPHRISLRLAARLLRLPLKGGVIGVSTAAVPACPGRHRPAEGGTAAVTACYNPRVSLWRARISHRGVR